ncbi:MAG: polyphosphate kinase 1 [Pseudomonadota bacterium]
MSRNKFSSRHFLNRELSQIEFNIRVLEQARDAATPLLERVRFLCISCTNLDEFFEIRVASLKQLEQFGAGKQGPDGLDPATALEKVHEATNMLVNGQYQVFNEELVPALAEQGVRVLRREQWSKAQKTWLADYFRKEVLPVLSPLGLDPVHPFPRLLNKSLNFAVMVQGDDAYGRDAEMALVRAPRSLPRVVQIPGRRETGYDFVFLSSILQAFVDQLFPGMQVSGCYQFRVTRNSELYVDEEEVEDLAQALKGELLERSFASAVRLQVLEAAPDEIVEFLRRCFKLEERDVFRCNGPVNLHRLAEIFSMVHRPDLKYPEFRSHTSPDLISGTPLFSAIGKRDYLMHHPFDAFAPVIDLLRQAAADPDVLAIKQTLYRTGKRSPIVELLIEAARAGKDVTAVIELRARFDEQENIELANQLQEAGIQVVYGIVGHKTHAKMLLIVRREGGKLRRYAHLGTGNYHYRTAAAYTDLGMLTADRLICADVHTLFQQLTGLGKLEKLKRLYQSPFTLREMLLRKIRREMNHVKKGHGGRIVARMNALTEASLIRALYNASNAGVQIDLMVRGACCLRPGIKGVSENIRVRSIVGRFLEHSRVFYFGNNGKREVYAASADWMDRNMYSRVECCFPIRDPAMAKRVVHETLEVYLKDNTQAWELGSDGSYQRLTSGGDKRFSAQEYLMEKRP